MSDWLNGIMGVVIGDALGCPVQFMERLELKNRPSGIVKGMESGGVYDTPKGTWTDDTSLTLATLDSIIRKNRIDLKDIMDSFVEWYENGEYTPFGQAFDIGNTCSSAIENYERTHDVLTCGLKDKYSNGNGSLMRLMPVCLYLIKKNVDISSGVEIIEAVSGITHNHLVSRVGCSLYFFFVKNILLYPGLIREKLMAGYREWNEYYVDKYKNELINIELLDAIGKYSAFEDIDSFKNRTEDEIKSTGYIVDTLEAAIWSMLNENNFKETLLRAVNLANDSDTVGAVTGGLSLLYYGYESIPEEWLEFIKRKEWIVELCSIISDL